MPNKVKLKRSYTAGAVPLTTDLDTNECAVNWADAKLFVKNAAGNIVSITLGGSGGGGSGALSGSVTIPGSGDLDFSKVPALLKFDGTGAAMVDSSSAGRAVTAFGNATHSTAQAKWGGSSLYLNGSTSGSGTPNYITFANGSDLDLGSQDFVIEFWMYASAQKFCPIVQHVNNTAGAGWVIWNYDTTDINTVTRKIGINIAGKVSIFSSGDAYSDNTWTHIAAVRSGSTLSLYSNGSRVATNSITGSITRPTSNTPKIGWLSASDWSSGIDAYYYNGHIDDLRITVGSDRGYQGASFTPPAAAFTTGVAAQTLPVTISGSGGGSGLTWSSVPASATATGTAGQIAYDNAGGFFYVATNTNTWKRAALTTWVNFAPTAITGLQLWLDASDAGSLYDATSGGSLVAADGAVARWEDKSGNARHFTQSTSGKRPTRKTAQQNGLDALLFDGSDDCLNGGNFINGSSGLTIFCVVKRANTSTSHRLLHKVEDQNPGWAIGALSSGVVKAESYADASLGVGTTRQSSASVNLSNFSLLQTTFPSGAFSTTSMRRNASTITMDSAITSGAGAETPSNSTALLLIGSNRYQGVDYNLWNGNIAEIAIYNGALSDTDRAAVESYLMQKWAIT